MLHLRTISIAAIAACLCVVSPAGAYGQSTSSPEQAEISRKLRSGSDEERAEALSAIRRIGVGAVSADVRKALKDELARTNAITVAAHQRREDNGSPDPEYRAELQRQVAETGDPDAIPLLADALGLGTLLRQLTELGEASAPSVIKVARDPSRHYSAVDEALRILRMMLENNLVSDETREAARSVARQRLTGSQYFTTFWYAMDLAAVVDDPGLTELIRRISQSPESLQYAGGTTDRTHAMTRQRAIDRLAGIPAQPRLESFRK